MGLVPLGLLMWLESAADCTHCIVVYMNKLMGVSDTSTIHSLSHSSQWFILNIVLWNTAKLDNVLCVCVCVCASVRGREKEQKNNEEEEEEEGSGIWLKCNLRKTSSLSWQPSVNPCGARTSHCGQADRGRKRREKIERTERDPARGDTETDLKNTEALKQTDGLIYDWLCVMKHYLSVGEIKITFWV